jgi:UPF0176 protein
MILATEGINGTISGEASALRSYLDFVSETLSFPQFTCKVSAAPKRPFHRFKVRVRPEIVTLGKPEVQPLPSGSETHLSPAQWDAMAAQKDVVMIDTRNWYETRIGKFKGALDPQLNEFHEFPEYLKSANLPKDGKFLIYCTGGIRCEKAIVEMHNQGFEKVYQLDGGILNYLAEKPKQNFEGECFVFDHRVAVDQELKPTEIYGLCPHCGQPADKLVTCLRCDDKVMICLKCSDMESSRTCSKNCANQYRAKPGVKGRSQRKGPKLSTQTKFSP